VLLVALVDGVYGVAILKKRVIAVKQKRILEDALRAEGAKNTDTTTAFFWTLGRG